MDFWTHIPLNKAVNILVHEWNGCFYAVRRNYFGKHIRREQHNAADKSLIFLSHMPLHATGAFISKQHKYQVTI